MKQDKQILTALEDELLRVNQAWFDAVMLAKATDPKRVLQELTAPQFTYLGTGRGELANSYDEWLPMVLKYWEQISDGAEYSIENLEYRIIGEVGLVKVIMNLAIKHTTSDLHILMWHTNVYEYTNNKWQAIHCQTTFPHPDQPEGEALPLDALKARNQELEKLVAERTTELENSLQMLKATQAQLIQSEKMASLGELTAGIAHEIQNPLNFINNFSDVNTELIGEMTQEIDKGNIGEIRAIANDVKENNRKIAHHGRRADAIVKSMLEHSRTSRGERQAVDINGLVDEYLRLSHHGLRTKDNGFSIIVETYFDHSIDIIEAVPQDIGRVLLNLFNNAFYAVGEKKKIQGDGYEPTVQVATQQVNGRVEITVRDNGIGIPEKVLEKIYQPFFTTKPTGTGTGLGLSLSYDIITKVHGGEIKVQTKEGYFTEFVVSIPASIHEKPKMPVS